MLYLDSVPSKYLQSVIFVISLALFSLHYKSLKNNSGCVSSANAVLKRMSIYVRRFDDRMAFVHPLNICGAMLYSCAVMSSAG